MTLSLIAAHDPDLVIGEEGGLPWHYKEDLRYFKETTMGCPVIMGRGVFEEIGEKPLPGRKNIVLSRSREWAGVTTCRSVEEALESVNSREGEVFVIGGGEIYRQTIDLADRLYITEIHKRYGGDTYFPEYRDDIKVHWREESRDDRGEFSFVIYSRINQR